MTMLEVRYCSKCGTPMEQWLDDMLVVGRQRMYWVCPFYSDVSPHGHDRIMSTNYEDVKSG